MASFDAMNKTSWPQPLGLRLKALLSLTLLAAIALLMLWGGLHDHGSDRLKLITAGTLGSVFFAPVLLLSLLVGGWRAGVFLEPDGVRVRKQLGGAFIPWSDIADVDSNFTAPAPYLVLVLRPANQVRSWGLKWLVLTKPTSQAQSPGVRIETVLVDDLAGLKATLRTTLGLPPEVSGRARPSGSFAPSELVAPAFTKVRLREGYSIAEVDAFVSTLQEKLRQVPPAITGREIDQLRFTPVRLQEGYDMGEVDTWLDKIARTHLGGSPEAPEPMQAARPLDASKLFPPAFTRVRMREGYSIAEVDAFAASLPDKVRQVPPAISADEINMLRFTPVRLREGYDMGEVDRWLDQVVAEMRRSI